MDYICIYCSIKLNCSVFGSPLNHTPVLNRTRSIYIAHICGVFNRNGYCSFPRFRYYDKHVSLTKTVYSLLVKYHSVLQCALHSKLETESVFWCLKKTKITVIIPAHSWPCVMIFFVISYLTN